MILMRVMERKTVLNGLPMSPSLIKEELSDLKEIVMIYEDKHAQTLISHKSSVQKRLCGIFELTDIEEQLTRH